MLPCFLLLQNLLGKSVGFSSFQELITLGVIHSSGSFCCPAHSDYTVGRHGGGPFHPTELCSVSPGLVDSRVVRTPERDERVLGMASLMEFWSINL